MRAEISDGQGVSGTRIHLKHFTLRLFDPNPPHNGVTGKQRWLEFCEDPFAVIFVVDLSCYDQPLPENPDANQMMETMMLFKSIVNSHWHRNTSVILFFNKFENFLEKLKASPLQNHFPDFAVFTGGGRLDSATAGSKYFRAKFNALNRTERDIYAHFVSCDDHGIMQTLTEDVRESVLYATLRDAGII